MLCSVLIASRNRFDKLFNTVASVFKTSGDPDFEVIVRLHRSDTVSCARAWELKEAWGDQLKIILGEDHDGYDSLGIFTHELVQQAKGQWSFHLNDDMIVTGVDWIERLREVPFTGYLVQPEEHRLNDSVYFEDVRSPAPIFPTNAIGNLLIQPGVGPAVDVKIHEHLVYKKGWKVWFLKGVGIHHQWLGTSSHVA